METATNTGKYALATLALWALLSGCEPQSEAPTPDAANSQVEDTSLLQATDALWQRGTSLLAEARDEAKGLRDAITTFLDTPSDENLSLVREAWHRAHNRYQRCALLIAFGHSNPGLFGNLQELDYPVDAWPIQPGYLDYWDVYQHSGIVNDIALPISADAIRRQHGFSDSSDVSLGFHAIAYLLWGGDGQRPVSDYHPLQNPGSRPPVDQRSDADTQPSGLSSTEQPNNRRRTLLKLLSELLIDDLQRFHLQWQFANSSLNKNYHNLGADSRQQLILSASTTLLSLELPAAVESGAAQHNRFAGSHEQVWQARIEGLQQLLQVGNPPLIEVMLTADQRLQWQAQLQTLHVGLEQLSRASGDAEQTAMLQTQVKAALQQARALIKADKPG